MNTKSYTITCKNCNGTSKVTIKDDQFIEYINITPIISARKRGDMQWGFECICGNDTRLCKEELENQDKQVQVKGSSKEVVEAVIDRMKLSTDDSFIMTEI